jgi:hypothetical protein
LGPVGLRLGPTVRADRTAWSTPDALLDHAVLVGGRAVVAVDVGPIGPYASVEPAWAVSGERAAPVDPTLPALGTETTWGAGLTGNLGLLGLGGHVQWHETQVGGVMQLSLSFAIRPPSNGEPDGDDR